MLLTRAVSGPGAALGLGSAGDAGLPRLAHILWPQGVVGHLLVQLDAAATGALLDIEHGSRARGKFLRHDHPYRILALRLDLQGAAAAGQFFAQALCVLMGLLAGNHVHGGQGLIDVRDCRTTTHQQCQQQHQLKQHLRQQRS